MANSDLKNAKTAKKDEFYTQLSDIELELKHYKNHFCGKVVFCNCDDPYESNFFKYFAMNFNQLGLKKLIATCYDGSPVVGSELTLDFGEDFAVETCTPSLLKRTAYKIEITEVKDENGDGAVDLADVEYLIKNDKNVLSKLKGNGDFRSEECVELLKEADIVVTNPPFSLFREYVALLENNKKDFIIMGNTNALTYKEIFRLFQQDRIRTGNTKFNVGMFFYVPDDSEKYHKIEYGKKMVRVSTSCWYTNLPVKRHTEDLVLYKMYNPEEYPMYDNYEAINVNTFADIPCDYYGLMGVPITFLDKYNPEQFEIVTLGIGEENFTPTKRYAPFRNAITKEPCSDKRDFLLYIKDKNGKYLTADGYCVTKCYARVIIRRKQKQYAEGEEQGKLAADNQLQNLK